MNQVESLEKNRTNFSYAPKIKKLEVDAEIVHELNSQGLFLTVSDDVFNFEQNPHFKFRGSEDANVFCEGVVNVEEVRPFDEYRPVLSFLKDRVENYTFQN